MRLTISIILILGFFAPVTGQNLVVRPQHNEEQNSFTLTVYSKYPCPINLFLESPELDTTFKALIPSEKEKTLFTWENPPSKLVNHLDKMFEYNFFIGDSNAVHDDEYQYELPYPVGKSYKLTQGNKTEFTHNRQMSKYAFDFAMPVGSLVSAARGGVVGYVLDKYKIGGNSISLMDKSNRIMICHDDGTVAAYAHLKQDGALVEVGDMVYAGQVIGLSGNTGYSTQPHLHFVVVKGKQSIPIRFRNQYTIMYEGEIYEHKE